MSVGDLVTSPYQYELNGILLGHDTHYKVTKVDGLIGPSPVSDIDFRRIDKHGAFFGYDRMQRRIVTFDISVEEDENSPQSDEEALLDALVGALVPTDGTYQLVTQRPGKVKRFLYCRPRKVALPSDYATAHGLCQGSFMLMAADPNWYSLVLHSVQVNIGAGSSGPGSVAVNNAGHWNGEPTLTIQGPCQNPIITNVQDSNRQLKLQVTMIGTDVLVIDMRQKTITLNGADAYGLLRADSQWWKLVPGSNTIQYTRADTGALTSLTVAWNDVWLSA